MHRVGLDGRPQKKLALFMSVSGSPKKRFLIAHENYQNKWRARFGAHLTFKMGRNGREANRMHRQGLDRHPQKNWHF